MRTATAAIESNPFPGLRPFREDEEHLFFGRENQVDNMVDKLAANRFLAVVGGSGSGKSSLVNCGLRPALHRGLMPRAGTAWRIAQFRPGSDPMRAMAAALAEDGVLFTGRKPSGLTMEEIVDTSLRMSKGGLIDIFKQARLGEKANLLVVVDQFEELFRYRQLGAGAEETFFGASEEATAFVNLLLEAASQTKYPIYVVLTMRSDFLGDCAEFTGLAESINSGQYLVPRMTRDERRAAISKPVGVGGAEIAPVLLTRLVNDVGDNPDQLSILQHALNRTWHEWEQTGGKGPLDLPHYEAIGTMEHALDHHAEEAYAELGSERRQLICEKIFKALTDKATDPRGVRRPTTLGNLCALADASETEVIGVIEVFRQPSYSFLMPPAGDPLEPDTVVDISHESLMRVWERLNSWAAEEAQSAHIYRRLAETSVLYEQGGAGLWRDPDLQVALGWQERNQPNEVWAQRYNPEFASAITFLKKSKTRRGRRRILTLGTAAAIFLFMSVALVAALTSRDQAVKASALATTALDLKDKADKSADSSRRKAEKQENAAKEAIAKARIDKDEAAVAKSRAEIERNKADVAKVAAVKANDEAKRNEGRALVEKKNADNAKILAHISQRNANDALARAKDSEIRANEAKEQAERLLYNGDIRLAQLEINDGQMENAEDLLESYLKTGPDDLRGFEWYYLWGKLYRDKGRLNSGTVRSIAFAPDGRTLATGGSVVKLWDVATQTEVTLKQPGGVMSLAFDRDGKMLATGGKRGVKIWDVATCKEAATCKEMVVSPSRLPDVMSVAFAPDGKTLAIGTSKGDVELWDVTANKVRDTLRSQSSRARVMSMAFDRDGKRLVTAGAGGRVTLWDVATQTEEATLREAGGGRSVAFAPDGKTLVNSVSGGGVLVWDVAKCKEAATCKAVASLSRQGNGPVLAVAFAPDGKTLATAGRGGVTLWDVATQKVEATLSISGDVRSLAFSEDGQTLAAGTQRRGVQLWDVATPKRAATMRQSGDIYSVAFAPDGKTFATGGSDDNVRLWDVAAQKELALLSRPGIAYSVAFAPDGKMFAASSADGGVKLWDAATQKEVATLSGHSGDVRSVAFAPDGKTLATGSSDASVKLWEVATQKKLATLLGHSGDVRSVEFAPDGNTLATGSSDGSVKLWDVASQKEVATLPGDPGNVRLVAFAPKGKTFATSGPGGIVKLWDVATCKETATCQEVATLPRHSGDVTSIAFDRGGKVLATGTKEGGVYLWDGETQTEVASLSGSGSVNSIAFAPNGKTMATGTTKRGVDLWDLATRKRVVSRGHTTLGRGHVLSVAFAPDGKTLATGGWDRYVMLWDAATQYPVATLSRPGNVRSVAFAPDGRTLATGGSVVKLWDVAMQKEVAALSGHSGDVISIAFDREGEILATGSWDNSVKLWDVETKTAMATLQGHQELVMSVAFAPDGKTLVTADRGGGILLWDVAECKEAATCKEVATLSRPGIGPVLAVAFAPNGNTVVAGGRFRGVQLWDVAECKEAATCKEVATLSRPGDVYSIAFAPDGRTLATGGTVVKLWDVATQKEIVTLPVDSGLVQSVAFDRDGKTLATGSKNGTVKLWFAPTDTEVGVSFSKFKVSEGAELAREGKIDEAIAAFEKARMFNPEIDFDPLIRGIQDDPDSVANWLAAPGMIREAAKLAEEGMIEDALAVLAEAKNLDMSLAIDAEDWNGLCWDGSLNGHAADVLFACEEAVKLRPDDQQIRDARGLARALTGDFKGAIQDFEFAIDSDQMGDDYNDEVRNWIKALNAGENPFTPELLKELRGQ